MPISSIAAKFEANIEKNIELGGDGTCDIVKNVEKSGFLKTDTIARRRRVLEESDEKKKAYVRPLLEFGNEGTAPLTSLSDHGSTTTMWREFTKRIDEKQNASRGSSTGVDIVGTDPLTSQSEHGDPQNKTKYKKIESSRMVSASGTTGTASLTSCGEDSVSLELTHDEKTITSVHSVERVSKPVNSEQKVSKLNKLENIRKSSVRPPNSLQIECGTGNDNFFGGPHQNTPIRDSETSQSFDSGVTIDKSSPEFKQDSILPQEGGQDERKPSQKSSRLKFRRRRKKSFRLASSDALSHGDIKPSDDSDASRKGRERKASKLKKLRSNINSSIRSKRSLRIECESEGHNFFKGPHENANASHQDSASTQSFESGVVGGSSPHFKHVTLLKDSDQDEGTAPQSRHRRRKSSSSDAVNHGDRKSSAAPTKISIVRNSSSVSLFSDSDLGDSEKSSHICGSVCEQVYDSNASGTGRERKASQQKKLENAATSSTRSARSLLIGFESDNDDFFKRPYDSDASKKGMERKASQVKKLRNTRNSSIRSTKSLQMDFESGNDDFFKHPYDSDASNKGSERKASQLKKLRNTRNSSIRSTQSLQTGFGSGNDDFLKCPHDSEASNRGRERKASNLMMPGNTGNSSIRSTRSLRIDRDSDHNKLLKCRYKNTSSQDPATSLNYDSDATTGTTASSHQIISFDDEDESTFRTSMISEAEATDNENPSTTRAKKGKERKVTKLKMFGNTGNSSIRSTRSLQIDCDPYDSDASGVLKVKMFGNARNSSIRSTRSLQIDCDPYDSDASGVPKVKMFGNARNSSIRSTRSLRVDCDPYDSDASGVPKVKMFGNARSSSIRSKRSAQVEFESDGDDNFFKCPYQNASVQDSDLPLDYESDATTEASRKGRTQKVPELKILGSTGNSSVRSARSLQVKCELGDDDDDFFKFSSQNTSVEDSDFPLDYDSGATTGSSHQMIGFDKNDPFTAIGNSSQDKVFLSKDGFPISERKSKPEIIGANKQKLRNSPGKRQLNRRRSVDI